MDLNRRIVINVQSAQNESSVRGIGRSAKDLVTSLGRCAQGVQFILVVNDALPPLADEFLATLSAQLHNTCVVTFRGLDNTSFADPANTSRKNASSIAFEQFVGSLDPDVFIELSCFEGLNDNSVLFEGFLPRNFQLGTFVHDLIPLHDPEAYLPTSISRQWYFERLAALKRSDFFLTNSPTTQAELLALLPQAAGRAHMVGLALSPSFLELINQEAPARPFERLGISARYVLHVGSYERRKNQHRLLSDFGRLAAEVRGDAQLVFVCEPDDAARRSLFSRAEKLGIAPDRLIVTGHVSDEELIALYKGAEVFVFPSLVEGFGLPVLEAMACGCPVLVARNSSLISLVDLNDATFDLEATDQLKDALERALTDEQFRSRLVSHSLSQASKWSWSEWGNRIIAAINHAMATNGSSPAFKSNDRHALYVTDLIVGMDDLTRADLIGLAQCYDHMAHVADELTVLTGARRPLDWMIDGHVLGHYSLAIVNRHIAAALAHLGHRISIRSADLDARPFIQARDVEPLSPSMIAMDWEAAGAESPSIHARNNYPLETAMCGKFNLLLCYAWEETGVPAETVRWIEDHVDGVIVTSRHVRKILQDNGVTVPIAVSGLGVDHIDPLPTARAGEAGPKHDESFSFLHVSSGLARKGISSLIDAFHQEFSARDDVCLRIKVPPDASDAVYQALESATAHGVRPSRIEILARDMTDADLAGLYASSSAAIFPTFAEGFGLPIAEAMYWGLPVIATGWSGHLDFCDRTTARLVDYRFAPSASHLGLTNSVWAEPDIADLRRAMRELYSSRLLHPDRRTSRGKALVEQDSRWTMVASRVTRVLPDMIQSTGAQPPLRTGWLTTFGSNCGIANYSRRLLRHWPDAVTVFATSDCQPPDAEMGRHKIMPIWDSASAGDGLGKVGRYCDRRFMEVLIVQFGFGLFASEQLFELVSRARKNGLAVVCEMHATNAPLDAQGNIELKKFAPVLHKCDRVIVHTVNDLNNLKDIGVVDNAVLIAHPVPQLRCADALQEDTGTDGLLISSYGFALPHKGLVALIEAVALLRHRGLAVSLELNCARHNSHESNAVISAIEARIEELALGAHVTCCFELLSENEVAQRLSRSSLIVFPYLESQESASGAVRDAMALGRPIAVSGAQIFNDVADVLYVISSDHAEAVAEGIERCLSSIAARDDDYQRVMTGMARWSHQHAFPAVAARMAAISRAVSRDQRLLDWNMPASSAAFSRTAGVVSGQSVISDGSGGALLKAERLNMRPGHYRVRIEGRVQGGGCGPTFRGVVSSGGHEHIMAAKKPLEPGMPFCLEADVNVADGSSFAIVLENGPSDDVAVDRVAACLVVNGLPNPAQTA